MFPSLVSAQRTNRRDFQPVQHAGIQNGGIAVHGPLARLGGRIDP